MSAFERATYSSFSSRLNSIAVGCDPGASGSSGWFSLIHRTTFPLVRSNSATFDAFHKLHHARRPSRVATHAYGYDDGTRSLVLRSKLCRTFPVAGSSSTALSERLFATRSLSLPPSAISARPAGYGIAVCGGAVSPTASFFPVDSGCGAIGMNRSGVTFPATNPYTAIPFPVSPAFAPVGSLSEPIDA